MKSDDKSPITREWDKFMLRLPEGVRERIASEAKRNGRSMNSEIVARIEQSFQPQSMILIDELENLLHGVLAQIKPPEFSDQTDDMPMDPPTRRVNTKRGKS